MLDAISLDQVRTFIAAAEEGSFSAAGRRLGRAQSVVSQTLANVEGQLGVRLFDRSGRYPVLTAAGRALIEEARAVVASVDLLRARARGLAGGLEPELSIVVDIMFPTGPLTCAVADFQSQFPSTPLRIAVEGLGAVLAPVLDGECGFGISGALAAAHRELTAERLLGTRMLMVAAPHHPLAALRGPIPAAVLGGHVQLVLSDRSRRTEGRDFQVFSPKTWRLSDLGAKHAFLRAGLGWGGMPLHVVEEDLASGALVPLEIEGVEPKGPIAMSAIYRTDTPPGPAGRWLIDRIKRGTDEWTSPLPFDGARARVVSPGPQPGS